jgi:hypothetical protein
MGEGQEGVAMRPTTVKVDCRKAAGEFSFPENGLSLNTLMLTSTPSSEMNIQQTVTPSSVRGVTL